MRADVYPLQVLIGVDVRKAWPQAEAVAKRSERE